MPERNAKDVALDYFAQKFSCAESVLLGLTETFGICDECIPQIATGFGAGMGYCNEACGAISGAIMALGLVFGRKNASDQDAKLKCYQKVGLLISAFEQKFGNVNCMDLTKCDMSTAEGRARSKELNLHGKLCSRFVAFAAETAQGIIESR